MGGVGAGAAEGAEGPAVEALLERQHLQGRGKPEYYVYYLYAYTLPIYYLHINTIHY